MNAGLLGRNDLNTDPRDLDIPIRLTRVELDHSLVMMTGDVQWFYSIIDNQWDGHFHNDHDQMNLVFLDGHVAYTQITRGHAYTGTYTVFTRWQDVQEALEEQRQQQQP